MPPYDAQRFSPPAPLALVTLRNPENGAAREDVPMLLDTGSDATLLPGSVMTALGVAFLTDKSYELSGYEGQISLAYAVRAELVFLGLTFRGQYLIIEQEWGIIGRNVLNAISLTFDGPRLTWDRAPTT
jgi:hypothetical protein